jgi:phage FluMu gp28-like protein
LPVSALRERQAASAIRIEEVRNGTIRVITLLLGCLVAALSSTRGWATQGAVYTDEAAIHAAMPEFKRNGLELTGYKVEVFLGA